MSTSVMTLFVKALPVPVREAHTRQPSLSRISLAEKSSAAQSGKDPPLLLSRVAEFFRRVRRWRCPRTIVGTGKFEQGQPPATYSEYQYPAPPVGRWIFGPWRTRGRGGAGLINVSLAPGSAEWQRLALRQATGSIWNQVFASSQIPSQARIHTAGPAVTFHCIQPLNSPTPRHPVTLVSIRKRFSLYESVLHGV